MSSFTGPPANKKRALNGNLETSFTHYLEASSYKTDLEYERSMRARDQRTAQAEHERLTKLLEFAQAEAERYQQLLHDERNEADIHAERLTQARDDAIVELRRLQEQQYENDDGHDNSKLWQRKIRLLQDQVLSKEGALDELKIQLAGVQQELRDSLAAQRDQKQRPSTPPPMAPPVGAVSPAPAELLQELNRIRIQLAETERSERQWQRKANTLQDLVAQQLVPEQETSRRLQLRNAELERQVKELRAAHETVQAEHVEYKTLAEELQKTLLSDSDTNTINPHSIVRRVQELKTQCTQTKESNTRLEQRVEQLKNWKGPMDVKLQQLEAKEQQWNLTKKQLQEELETYQGQVTTLQRTQAILQREIASLQEINASLDSLEDTGGVTTISLQQKLSAARVELQSSQEAHATTQADRDRIQTALEKALQETKEGTQELTRVKEKYGKLREALELQKQAAAEAEQRAVRAEELAGKGSFNPNTTRVVHLSHNPLTTTLKEQNATLKQQLQEANQKLTKSGDKAVTASSSSTNKEVDPNKLHQRLKQQFRDQIGLFREGVHLITGYKIDMLPNQKRTRFRVRSMYAAHESDELVFEWPKKAGDGEDAPVTTLHCMNTEWAKKLARETSSSMEYMTKYNSIPAFVASVQLAEFEKQTLMG